MFERCNTTAYIGGLRDGVGYLARVQPLRCNEKLLLLAVLDGVVECDLHAHFVRFFLMRSRQQAM